MEQAFGSGLFTNAHSSYFFLLLEIGALGLAFYLAFHVGLFVSLWNTKVPRAQKMAVMMLLVTALMIGISLNTLMYTSFQWVVYLFVGSALNLKLTEEDNSGAVANSQYR